MKNIPNSSSNVYAKIPRVLIVIYLFYSIILDYYNPPGFEIYEIVKTKVIDESEQFIQMLLDSVSISFFKNLTWYLFPYILLESFFKILSLIEVIGRMLGRPMNRKIKRLHNFTALLILLLGGKFIIFIICSLFEYCNF